MNFTSLNQELKRANVHFADSMVAMFKTVLQGLAADISIDKRPAKAARAVAPRAKAKAAKPAPKASKPAPKASKPAPKAAKPAPKAAKPAPKAAKPAPKAATPAKARGGRRTPEELEQFGNRVLELLKQRPQGLRIEQINRELSTSTSDLMRPIKKMLDDKRLTKKGDRRATVYFAS